MKIELKHAPCAIEQVTEILPQLLRTFRSYFENKWAKLNNSDDLRIFLCAEVSWPPHRALSGSFLHPLRSSSHRPLNLSSVETGARVWSIPASTVVHQPTLQSWRILSSRYFWDSTVFDCRCPSFLLQCPNQPPAPQPKLCFSPSPWLWIHSSSPHLIQSFHFSCFLSLHLFLGPYYTHCYNYISIQNKLGCLEKTVLRRH